MTGHKQSHRLVLCGSLTLGLVLAGCQDHSGGAAPPAVLPTESLVIFIAGQCRSSANTIVCRDSSWSQPQNHLRAVTWEVIDTATGLSQGSTPTPPGGEFSSSGLASGTYQVNQKVIGDDNSSQSRTYGPYTIF
jgi:hypothetical protein